MHLKKKKETMDSGGTAEAEISYMTCMKSLSHTSVEWVFHTVDWGG